MAQEVISIAAEDDDAIGYGVTNATDRSNVTSVKKSFAWIMIGQSGGYRGCMAGMRFNSVDIAKDATVSSAVIKVNAYQSSNFEPSCRIVCEDNDDAATFVETDTDFESANRPATTAAAVNWDNIEDWVGSSWYTCPSFDEHAEEVFARPSWASGNDFVVFFENRVTGAYRQHYFDSWQTDKAELTIDYTAGGGGGNLVKHQAVQRPIKAPHQQRQGV